MYKKEIKFLYIALIVLFILLIFIFNKSFFEFFMGSKNKICLDAQDKYRCIVDTAIQDKDPSYCWFLDAGRSDICSEEVLRAVPDVALCKKIPQWGIRMDCYNTFKK